MKKNCDDCLNSTLHGSPWKCIDCSVGRHPMALVQAPEQLVDHWEPIEKTLWDVERERRAL